MNSRSFSQRYHPDTLTDSECKTLYADWTSLMWSALDLKRSPANATPHVGQDISITFFQAAAKCQHLTEMDIHFPDQSQYKSGK